jgi:hypothetical protein
MVSSCLYSIVQYDIREVGNENQDSVWLGEVNQHENTKIGATMLIISVEGVNGGMVHTHGSW